MLMVKLSGFKHIVRANRFGCDTDLAREAHDILIAHLDEFREDLDRVIALCERIACRAGPR